MQAIAATIAAALIFSTGSESTKPPRKCTWATIEQLSPAGVAVAGGEPVTIRAGISLPLSGYMLWEVQWGHYTYEWPMVFQACSPERFIATRVISPFEVIDGGMIVGHGVTVFETGQVFPINYYRRLTCSSGVASTDIVAVINNWGASGEVRFVPADFTLDGVVNASDLLWAIQR